MDRERLQHLAEEGDPAARAELDRLDSRHHQGRQYLGEVDITIDGEPITVDLYEDRVTGDQWAETREPVTMVHCADLSGLVRMAHIRKGYEQMCDAEYPINPDHTRGILDANGRLINSGTIMAEAPDPPPSKSHDPRAARAATLKWLRGRKRRKRR